MESGKKAIAFRKTFLANVFITSESALQVVGRVGGPHKRVLQIYQRSLNPNWICREVVDVLVMTPAVGETPVGVRVIKLGVLKLA